MKKKIFILIAGLLLAVGWTADVHAQLKGSEFKAQLKQLAPTQAVVMDESHVAGVLNANANTGVEFRAPMRANYNVTADVVHPTSWYTQFTYQWNNNGRTETTAITDSATNPRQQIAMLKKIYTTPEIPGIKYSAAQDIDDPYYSVAHGWNITGTTFDDVKVVTNSTYAYMTAIIIEDLDGGDLVEWFSDDDLPTGWTSSKPLQNTTYNDGTNHFYASYMQNGGTITIPGNLLTNSSGGIYIYVYSATPNASSGATITFGGGVATLDGTWRPWNISNNSKMDTPPTANGYTVMLVKLNDEATTTPPSYTADESELESYFDTYVDEIKLLTDGLRVGENTPNVGTIFSYTGRLNRFYFISKGKMFALNITGNSGDFAPTYSMFEEFSPSAHDGSETIEDFYPHMAGGENYGIVHDCQGVNRLGHYFAMSGATGTEKKYVTSLVFYIPDNRGSEPTARDYVAAHKPTVGLYTIRLNASAVPSDTYDQDSTYTVTLDWTSSLNQMASNTVDQHYYIYKVYVDDEGVEHREFLDEVDNITTYSYSTEKQMQTSYTITYIVVGTPIYPDEDEIGDRLETFFAESNPREVLIPGWYDFLKLERDHYESDFVIPEETNYYRNYLYPTNIAPLTGMTVDQLKHEWPNQTAQYVLWRNDQGVDKGVALLEVKAIGDKVYYRIRYQRDSQVTTGPNLIEGLNIVEMDNVNE